MCEFDLFLIEISFGKTHAFFVCNVEYLESLTNL